MTFHSKGENGLDFTQIKENIINCPYSLGGLGGFEFCIRALFELNPKIVNVNFIAKKLNTEQFLKIAAKVSLLSRLEIFNILIDPQTSGSAEIDYLRRVSDNAYDKKFKKCLNFDSFYKSFIEPCDIFMQLFKSGGRVREIYEEIKNGLKIKLDKNNFKLINNKLDKEVFAMQSLLCCRFANDTFKHILKRWLSLITFDIEYHDFLSTEGKKRINRIKKFYHDCISLNSAKDFDKFKQIYEKAQAENLMIDKDIKTLTKEINRIITRVYNEASTDFSEFPETVVNGVHIYNCGKSPFQMFISVTDCYRKDCEELYPRKYDAVSCSFVSDNSLITFKDLRQYVAFGYTNLAEDSLIQCTSFDNYSLYKHGESPEKNSIYRYPNDYLTPDKMLEKSKKDKTYNEFNFLSVVSDSEITDGYSYRNKPSCIFCLGEPKKIEYILAMEKKIPIVVVDVPKYEYYGETEMREHTFEW